MPLLELSDVTVTFSGLRALSGVSLVLDPGEIRAVIGPNGAGKSTLFNVITGYVTPSSGSVRFDGRDLVGMPPHGISGLGMRRTFQSGGIFPQMTVLENVLTGLNTRTGSTPFGLLFRTRRSLEAERRSSDEALSLLEELGLLEFAHRIAGDLSSGQQRQVEIARALAARTRLLLLDEPAVGLTAGERDHLMKILRELASTGISVLLVEHAIDLVMAVSDRILVLNYGEVIAEGLPEHIRSHEAVLEAYLGQH